ncbi:MAG: MucB/RseB C-terminal domain-containing protein [Gammaproteobacteria bacterium]|nr:MucB/RseB C-terminal domain-containing protein [Gammaproteobacteria bacterium]
MGKKQISKMNPAQLLLLLAVVFVGQVSAQDADAWLNKMTNAMAVNNYQGTMIIRQADKVDTLFVQHGVNDKGIWESLEFLNGESRKVVRTKDTVKTIFPERKLVTVSHEIMQSHLHPELPENISDLKQYYSIQLTGVGRVARKPAQILEIKPKDQFRYGFKFWLDKDTGLLLKCDLMNSKGDIVEQLIFSELTLLNKSPVTDQENEYADFQLVNLDQGRKQSTDIWKAAQLPDGFILTRASTRPSSSGKGLVYQVVYSDGMASVSVFVEKQMPAQRALQGVSTMGVVNAFGRPVNGHQVTVIGEVPVETVKLIGQSIRYTQ